MPPDAPLNPARLPVIRRVAAKEITLFFASPIAWLFLGAFAAVTLFVFFWGEAFFARNIADVRPLFEWMPVLLIFLASTLTMRLWSEERRTGTLEHVLTQPTPLWCFVAGKFLGCVALLLIVLTITLPLPLTVAFIGELDWGPVWAGYLATLLLGSAYLSIGLFVSARSENQIVSLISATALCGVFYLIGTGVITDFFGTRAAEWLRLIGSGARFDAITRGMIDLRDLYYYISIVAVFLVLNTYVLERQRWAPSTSSPQHRWWNAITLLLVINVLAANLWLSQMTSLRMDTTAGKQYSISPATRNYLGQLQEPLLLRGYFSSKTHPLLAPLVPQLRDLLREYEIAGQGRVRVEFVDPLSAPALEEEANQKYGIQPVPFQVADRYQASIVSSYFNVLVEYGDVSEVLGFQELIEIKARSEMDVDVVLRNPEYDLTRAVRKVLQDYQAGGNLFDTVQNDIAFVGYVSPAAQLPEPLADYRETVQRVLDEMAADSGGRLLLRFVDPLAGDGALASQIADDFGFRTMTTSLLSDERFYFYLTLQQDGTVVQIPMDDRSEDSFRRSLQAGIKRFASGFTRSVALAVPPVDPMLLQYGMGGAMYTQLEQFLAADLNVQREDLSDGSVSGTADILMLVAPENLGEREVFAVDQFLMQGGTVVIATSPFAADFADRSLAVAPRASGLETWLAHHGISIGQQLVLDPQNAAFPVPVTRNVGGFQVQELRLLDYPFFPDLRAGELNRDHPVTADLPQLTLAWASPIVLDIGKQGDRNLVELLRSSPNSWLSDSPDVMPRADASGLSTFEPEGETGSQLLGVISSGRFESFFTGRPSPRLASTAGQPAPDEALSSSLSGVIERSPESARIVLFSSNDFLRDQVVQLTGAAGGSEYLNSLQLLANTVDWALEDSSLVSIRSRGQFSRTLPPMDQGARLFWEYLNYLLAAVALGIVALIRRQRQRARLRDYTQLLAG